MNTESVVAGTTAGDQFVAVAQALFVAPVQVLFAVATVAVAVKVSGEPARPAEVAVTDPGPVAAPSVQLSVAIPEAFVTELASDTLPPPEATAQLIVRPATGLTFASVTSTASGAASTVLAGPLCAAPSSPRYSQPGPR